ncbi:hypothetical protein [Agreia sp. COWG]|nr:hypothetical protein [Agreia sp. COWG]CAD6005295.1 protein of unknown function [Agreia sp. COWG]
MIEISQLALISALISFFVATVGGLIAAIQIQKEWAKTHEGAAY